MLQQIFSKVRVTDKLVFGKKGRLLTTNAAGVESVISTAELGFLDGVTAGTAAASKAVVLDANKDIASLRHITLTGNIVQGATTISEAELATLDGVVAGTASASKAVVLGADKNVDTIAVAEGGLKIGAGAGTAMTASAAELNFNDGSVAGTAVAGKAAVLGATKNLDTLSVATLLAPTSVAIGGGTAITKIVVYSQSLDVASVAINTTAEQTFTVTGLTTADKVFVNKPSLTAGLGVVNARVSAADTLAITFVNATGTAIDPAAETYTIVALRS